MAVPTDRKYLRTHEWHLPNGNVVTIGITKFATDQLTDITFVDLPKPGTAVKAGEKFGEIESVKATGELYSGVSGTVSEINANLSGAPELVNGDPFGAGWMVKVTMSNPAELGSLLSPADYEQLIGG